MKRLRSFGDDVVLDQYWNAMHDAHTGAPSNADEIV